MIFNYIPGFRSRTKWKMIVAGIYYVMCFTTIPTSIFTFLFSLSIPFFIFYILKGIKEKDKKCLSIGGIVFVILIISAVLSPKTQYSTQTTSTDNKPKQNETTATDNKPKQNKTTFSNLEIKNVQASNGKVLIDGITDLPDNSKVTVSFDVAGQKDTDTYLGVSQDVQVKNGTFSASITPPNIQEYTKGNYNVDLLFTPKAQSDDVLKLVGKNGENLSGSNKKTDNDLKFNTLETTKDVQLNLNLQIKTYPMVNPSSYQTNTPEYALSNYLLCWKNKDWDNMANYTQLTWKNGSKDPSSDLKNFYSISTLLGAEITGKQDISNIMKKINVTVYYTVGSPQNEVQTKNWQVVVLCESAAYTPNVNGTWGVNPVSAINFAN